MKIKFEGVFAVIVGAALAASFALAPTLAWGGNNGYSQKYPELTKSKVNAVIDHYKKTAGELEHYFNDSYGYVVFPSIGVGPGVVGKHYGTGAVYKHDVLVGRATIVKLPMGMHKGGQTFSEVIFFQDERHWELFTEDNFHFQGNAMGAQVRGGLTPSTKYSNGMAVFVNVRSGASAAVRSDEVKIGGQEVVYDPIGGDVEPLLPDAG